MLYNVKWLYSLTTSDNVFLQRGSFGRRWAFLPTASSIFSLKRLSTWWSVWVADKTCSPGCGFQSLSVLFCNIYITLLRAPLHHMWAVKYWLMTSVLCEQGNLQVFYQDLPLSIQDGYEKFLSSSAVSLQQYQVRVNIQQIFWRTALLNGSNHSFSSQRCSGIWRGLAMWCTDSIPGNRILMPR